MSLLLSIYTILEGCLYMKTFLTFSVNTCEPENLHGCISNFMKTSLDTMVQKLCMIGS